MQTILGSGGAIGVALARILTEYTDKIRLVSRNPEKVNPGDELLAADLLNPADVDRAMEGSSVVYVTVGFPYRLKTWQESWPVFTRNLIDACVKHKCKMVFFDNIYMYDKEYLDGMTEETPINPPSKKGEIRMLVANQIMEQGREGKLTACIARCADFYGPGIRRNSVLAETVFKPLSLGKSASWLASVNFRHSYTYTPDAARATAMLGNSDEAFGQVWHLPTAPDPFTGKGWIEAIAQELEAKPKFMTASSFILRIMGLFNPLMRELPEMLYQYDRDYVFNSDKFEKYYHFSPTSYMDGIRAIVNSDFK
jgi:nucleoside-diphosphate-sugar epimerase